MNKKTILVVTNKYDPDADLVIKKLNKLSENVIRFNTEDFPTKAEFVFDSNKGNPITQLYLPHNRIIDLSEIKSIWYRKPKPHLISNRIKNKAFRLFAQRESQVVVNGFYELFKGLWLSHPLKIRSASRKVYQLQSAMKLDLRVPATLITNNPEKVKKFYSNHIQKSIITKPLSFPLVEEKSGYYTFSTSCIREKDLESIDQVKYTPTLFQVRVPKKHELRINVVGNKIFVCEIYSQVSEKTKLDWRLFDQKNPIPHKIGKLPKEIKEKCIRLVKDMGLLFGAIDMIVTPDNNYIFLEINPTGIWGWIEELTGLPISQAIIDLLVSGKKEN